MEPTAAPLGPDLGAALRASANNRIRQQITQAATRRQQAADNRTIRQQDRAAGLQARHATREARHRLTQHHQEKHPPMTNPGPIPLGRDLADDAYNQLHAAQHLTTDQLQKLISLAGRNYGPTFLSEAYSDAIVDTATVTTLAGPVWSSCEYPDRQLDRDDWRWLFQAAGFTIDGQPAERPTQPIELWRGTVPERRTDWSWSTDRAVAERFAAGIRGRAPGRLYRLMCPPEALLAANTERGEAEYVVDTAIVEHLIEETDR